METILFSIALTVALVRLFVDEPTAAEGRSGRPSPDPARSEPSSGARRH